MHSLRWLRWSSPCVRRGSRASSLPGERAVRAARNAKTHRHLEPRHPCGGLPQPCRCRPGRARLCIAGCRVGPRPAHTWTAVLKFRRLPGASSLTASCAPLPAPFLVLLFCLFTATVVALGAGAAGNARDASEKPNSSSPTPTSKYSLPSFMMAVSRTRSQLPNQLGTPRQWD